MHISLVYSPLELTYSAGIPLNNAENAVQLLTFRSLLRARKAPRLIRLGEHEWGIQAP